MLGGRFWNKNYLIITETCQTKTLPCPFCLWVILGDHSVFPQITRWLACCSKPSSGCSLPVAWEFSQSPKHGALIHITTPTQETIDSQNPQPPIALQREALRPPCFPVRRAKQIGRGDLVHGSGNTITCRERARQWSTGFLKQLQFSLSFLFSSLQSPFFLQKW